MAGHRRKSLDPRRISIQMSVRTDGDTPWRLFRRQSVTHLHSLIRSGRRLTSTLAVIFVLFLAPFCILYGNIFSKTATIDFIRHSKYCVAYNVTRPSKSFRKDTLEPVSVTAHTSAYMLHNLYQLVSSYDGPISLAVYLEKDIENTIPLLKFVHKCDEVVNGRVAFHIVTQRSVLSNNCPSVHHEILTECTKYNMQSHLKLLKKIAFPSLNYPINVLRNVARRGSSSSLQIVTDIEMIFSNNFYENVLPIANELMSTRRTVLVFRRFETEDYETVPRTVEELKEQIERNTTIQFHSRFFADGHSIPGLEEWINTSIMDTVLSVHEVKYGTKKWEPQFIMHSSDPFHDESIPTRHRDHQVLCYELCRARYRFLVLSHVFNIHRGIKKKASYRNLAIHELGQPSERAAVKAFNRKMDVLYPGTRGKCTPYVERKATLYDIVHDRIRP